MNDKSILIVEDSEIDQYLAKYVIEKYDPELNILQAFDGEEALSMLNELTIQPLIILLDINMPRMNGHEFLEKYEASSLDKTSIIMLTSSFQITDREKCLAHSCVKKYLTKPIEIQDIASVIRSA